MITRNSPEFIVFAITNSEFTAIGSITEYTEAIWPDRYNKYDSFEIHAPITAKNTELFQKNNVIWNRGKNAAIIEIITCELKDTGERQYTIKGRTLEAILDSRIVWDVYNCTNKYTSTIMYDLVNENCVNPSNKVRKIPYLYCAEDAYLGKQISYQESDSTVYEALVDLSQEAEIGFTIDFIPSEKRLVFRVYQGNDLSNIYGTNGSTVVLSTNMEDILSSEYYLSVQAEKNVALVKGEGSGVDRKRISVGETSLSGWNRRELHVDAKDLQSTIQQEDGSEKTLTETEYLSNLSTRGLNELAKHLEVQTFEADIRTINGQYEFGIDYNKGDKILIQDPMLGIQLATRITGVTYSHGKEDTVALTFGYPQLSLIQRLKQSL